MNILNRKNWIIFLLAGFVAAIILVGSPILVIAQETTPVPISKIIYPVAELGNCTNQQECRTYCGTESNYSKCAAFAQKHGLETEIPPEKRVILEVMQKGQSPGGCKDEVSCRNYCEDADRLEECVNFVEKFNLASADDLKEMRKMSEIKKTGVSFPGNCKTKESCLAYCDDSANAVECMEFAQKAGFIPKEDAEAVSKILPYLKSGGKLPGGCATKESCDKYCGDDANANICVDFAVKAGFMTKEDAEIVRKTGGKGPGNCRSREACDNYCKDVAHIDECVDFAVKTGFISQEDADQAKKYKITSGPGNCKSKTECEAFCVLPENQDTCFNFAKDHGILNEEDLKNIEEQKDFLKSLDRASPEWLACMEKELGSKFFGRFKTGKLTQAEAKSSALEMAQRKCGSEEVQGKIDACLSGSCSKLDACMKALAQSSGEQSGQQQGQTQGIPDSKAKVEAKIQACQQEKVNSCLAKSCGEFQGCLNSLGVGSGGEQQSAFSSAVMAKFQSCQPPQPSKGERQQGGDQGAIECAKQGGSWVGGSRCDFSKQGAGFQTGECAKQGGVWIGTKCDFSKIGDQSQIPLGYYSWEAFCTANRGDSRCVR